MRKVRVSFSGLNDMLNFKKMKGNRMDAIKEMTNANNYQESNTNKVAKLLHPNKQEMVIKDIITENRDCKTFVLERKDGKAPAPFKAGQHINVFVEVDGVVVSRVYTLSSSPKQAREGEYRITVKAIPDGLVSNYLLGTLDVGEELVVSAPFGTLYYNSIRDENMIVALAGGTGITPFYSLAQAIIDGDEDCLLTIFYGVRKEEDILFLEGFDDIVSKTNKVKVIYVLSEEKNAKYEHGLITKKLIDKYVSTKVSFYLSGPERMYEYLNRELAKYELPNKFFRYELPVSKSKASGKSFVVRVRIGKDEILIPAQEKETLMSCLNRANISIPSSCHTGVCGFCRTKLISGEVYMDSDHRRLADAKFNYIHPCVTYARSDLIIEIPM